MLDTYRKPRHQQALQPRADRLHRNPADEIRGEGMDQQAASILPSHSPAAKIEKRVFIQLSDGGAVGAPNVVGVNLQLGLRVHQRLLRKQEVFIGLLGVGFLRIFPHHDLPIEDSVGAAREDSFVEFPAGAVRLRMINKGVIVDVLGPLGQVESIQDAFDSLAIQDHVDVVPDQRHPGRWSGMRIGRYGKGGTEGRHVVGLLALPLQLAQVHHRPSEATTSVTELVK
jgi:hypothetical protein